MKKICLVALVLLGGVAIASQGVCQEKAKPAAAAEAKAAAPAKAHKARTGNLKPGSFVGSVVWADPGTKTITIKGRGKIVTFDASNPTFRGYRSLEDVKEGTYVSVSYTRSGLRVSRATRAEAAQGPAPEPAAEKPVAGKTAKKGAKSKIPRVQQKGGLAFCDVDENKDGKVTAVELSTVMSGLTIDKFKGYDRNNDGCLNESEYKAALRDR